MGVFNVASVLGGPKKSGGGASSYGIMVDQLSILENQLSLDGNLAPGDYDVLLKNAMALRNNPGLTANERSKVDVKISEYTKSKVVKNINDNTDIERLNRDSKDDLTKSVRLLGNNPQAFMETNAAVLNAKLERLRDNINGLEDAGSDATLQTNEYNSTLNDLIDLRTALTQSKDYQDGTAPKSNLAAFISTNAKGEITNIELKHSATSQQGYAATNAVYGGLPVFGHINRNENGKNIFQLGAETYSAPDTLLPGADGTFKQNTLVSSDQQQGSKAYSSANSTYKTINPANIRVQNAIDVGGWAQGAQGVLYKRTETGRYQKYVNADKAKLGIKDSDIIPIPNSMETSINSNVDQTIDAAGPLFPSSSTPSGIPGAAGGGGIPAPATTTPSNARPLSTALNGEGPAPAGGGRTVPPAGPSSRAPTDAKGVASQVYDKAKSFVGNLFA